MLPAIYFIFSRRGCDKAVRDLGSQCLVSKDEQARISARLKAYARAIRKRCVMGSIPMQCCAALRPTTPVFCPPGRS